MKKGFFVLLGLSILGFSAPKIQSLCEGFVPENDLWISAVQGTPTGINQGTFNNVIEKIEGHYKNVVSSKGGNLIVRRNWDDGTVNASAQQIFGFWIVNMYGGLARHETITADGFALVMCHELGHHIGGAPKIGGGMNNWASNEGQSDYFANLKCLRTVWQNENNVQIVENMEVDDVAVEACESQWASANDIAICIRGAMAGMSVSKLFQALRNETEPVRFDTPDSNVVSDTDDSHPGSQCRLDTYFHGSLCEASHTTDVDKGDPAIGTCARSRGADIGIRPLCWYKPN